MFKKPFKIKSHSQTKASERKQFKDVLLKTFPNLTADQVNDLLPKKEILNTLKLVTFDNVVVQVYTVQKRPVIFELNGRIYPTVFLLWKFPHLIYSFTTHQQVMSFISSGADLMLPGVVTPSQCSKLQKYGSVLKNEIVCVNLTNNQAAVAVGVTFLSSADMSFANSRGRCVNIYHFYGDKLCSLENMPTIPIPNLGAPDWLKLQSFDDDFPELGSVHKLPARNISEDLNDSQNDIINVKENTDDPNISLEKGETENVEEMDELLIYCFLGALKYSKSLSLPVLTSNFFKLQVLPLCPLNKTLDIKKTSFRKLKPFLEKMSQDGVIIVKEMKKGVEVITAINKDNPIFSQFYIDPENRPKRESDENENLQKRDVLESYIITQNVLPLFEKRGHKKGDSIQVFEVRKCVVEYIKENNLQDEMNAKLVKPKDILVRVCKTQSSITWEEVIENVCEAMKNCYKVKTGNEELVAKGKISPIMISVSVRSGNKKVTLIDNLELFGIRMSDFAKECQHGVAASTSISRPPGKKSDQLLVQGNQVLFIYNLLIDKYKIPKKYIKGLENAPKKK